MQNIISVVRNSAFMIASMMFLSCNGSQEVNKNENKPFGNDSTLSGVKPQILVFDKLIGTWKNEDGKSFERWTKNDNGYKSVGFRLKGADTIYTEQVMVRNEDGKWISENTVVGQNEGKAVKFIASILTDNTVQFGNPAHDFPTDINYTVANANTLNAFIVGPNNKGGKDTIPFNFIRVN
jgi:hypothetical protein